MTSEDVYNNLCYYDPRNPDYDAFYSEDIEPRQDDCYCDNCFYGRDVLAMEILKLLEK